MENEQNKLFVGGISRETGEEDLKLHFQKYGAVLSSLVARDKATGNPRGFGFVQFYESSAADLALGESHSIRGRTVEVKKVVPRSEQHQFQQQQQVGNSYQHRNNGLGNPAGDGNSNDFSRNNKKIFVGGLPSSLTKEQFKNYFERFGRVVDVVVMQDSSTNRPRGFGFITFESEYSVDRVTVKRHYELNGRSVEVKRAVPKDEINANTTGYTSRGGGSKPSSMSVVSGTQVSHGSGYHFPSSYANSPSYIGVPGYVYGTAYGRSYPMLGYGGTGYGVSTVLPRSPWNGNMLIGPAFCASPYNNGSVYHAYMTNGVRMPGRLYNQAVFPTSNGYLNQVYGGNGHLLTRGAPPSG